MAVLVSTVLVAAGLVLTANTEVAARQGAAAEKPTPAGKWTMTLDTPHGTVIMTFDLKLTTDAITGSITTDTMGTVPVTGTFTDGKVAFATGGTEAIAFHFTFKDKDTMTGNLSSPMGDLACTASRPKDK